MVAFPELEMLANLVTDPAARQGVAEMFNGYADGLTDLFRERKIRQLRGNLRALLLLAEAVAAVEAKAGGVA